MIFDWGIELLKGIGRGLLNPVFYYLIILAALVGVSRVKRERRNFHVRAQDAYFELRQLLPLGLIVGLVLSIVMIGIGIVIPIEVIIFVAMFTFLLSFTKSIRLLSPIYTVGLAFFASFFFLSENWSFTIFHSYTPQWNVSIVTPVAILLCLLIVAEGIFIYKNGSKGTSPKIIKSKRGLRVGVHEVKRVWMLPVLLMIPGDAFHAIEWWPLFSIGGQSYSIMLVPFAIGFYQQTHGMLPVKAVKQVGKRVIVFGVLLACLSSVSYWYPLASIVIVAIGMIGREMLSMRQRLLEDSLPFYFSRREHGLMILGIIPESPAEKMGLEVGELITKVNGTSISDEESFYESLQKNRAHCKLEVLDVNDQIRFVQRALYEGDHHELGILFVQDEKKWEDQVVDV